MKNFLYVSLLFAVFTASPVFGDTDTADSDVVVLTNNNFDDVIKGNDTVLVKFYAPWCGHCMKMAPEYAKAAKMLKEKGSKVVIAKVDAVAETALADVHKIGEFPTINFFRNQKKEKYTGGRTAEQIVEWIEKMTGPAVIVLTDAEKDISSKVSKDAPFSCMGEFEADETSAAAKMYEAVAQESRQVAKFYAIYKTGSKDKLYCVRFEEGNIPYTGDVASQTEFKSFVDAESFPLFGPIHGENFWKYNDRDLPLAWFCGTESDFNTYKSNLREASKDFRKTYSFVWLDIDQFRGHAESALGLSQFPGLAIQKVTSRYLLPDASNTMKDAKKVVQFINDVDAGKIEKDLKSEPVPAENNEAVKVVVGKTFEEMVVTKDHDVFLEVYSPWCVYCKNFEPIYKEFAEKMQKTYPHVVVAKIDGTANESPLDEFNWNSFPTVYFVKAGEKVPKKFEGSRTVEGLTEFLEANTSKKAASSTGHDEL